ncbi:hypothetical protein A4H97_18820 [Niastella yeongjuensis]|uniref:Uncharacterized protein n=1 Tax=Niastella yeongjuensis TaxID=354355 RepID=A0A1V9DY45_9BACT|nr:hypothetical protein [Niastella yeongjuensis]OQP38772.1 hypothetical protein A4H97_18820 [Niastella yeongjuensis]SEO33216.1 hypothetical protein SAMN05660816_02639 [Niastella yeongjuensis]
MVNNKAELYILGALALIGLVLYLKGQSELCLIEKDGVYVVGYIPEASSVKNGVSYTCYYKYNKESYRANYKDIRGLKKGDLMFFRISSSKPSVWRAPDIPVPPCIKLENMPDTGWKQLSKCS